MFRASEKKRQHPSFVSFRSSLLSLQTRHHVKLGEDDDDDDEIPPALHQPRERFNLVPKSFTNSLPNEIWEGTQRGIVRGNSRSSSRRNRTLENGRHWALVIGRAITITSASRISRHDFMMSCSFRSSLVGSGRRGEALRALLSDAKSSFVASSNVVVRREEEEEQTEEESLGVFVASGSEGIKTNAKIFTLEK